MDAVDVYETHISLVFVAGDRAYKVKKAVRFPFLDYSTPERRRHYCEEEVRLNRRLAPSVYLGVVPITADGKVRGEGEAVEYAVEMVRLPHDRMLDVLVEQRRAEPADIERIADVVARFHADAPTGPGVDEHGTRERLRAVVANNLEDARPFLPEAWHAHLLAADDRFLRDEAQLFDRRVAEGRIRDGHGDLHAGNICLRDDEVVIYDCIEFEPDFRCCDVAGEIAFLAMDLERRGARDLARLFVDRYVERTGDRELLAMLPFFKRHRASVRGVVESLRAKDSPAAREYFRLAVSYGFGPFLVVLCGLQATGKSFAAQQIARAFGAVPVSSDRVRKELYGMAPTEHWEGGYRDGPYDPALTEKTYATLRERTGLELANGRRVVVDATFAQRRWRDLLRAEARDLGAPCLVVHIDAAADVVRARMAERAGDAAEVSDADLEVYEKTSAVFERPLSPDIVHDGTGPAAPLLDAIIDCLIC